MGERNKEKEKPARKAGLKVGSIGRSAFQILLSDISNDKNIVLIESVIE